jgi:hypothetical protein
VCAVPEKFSFYGKRAGKFLSAKYARAAEVRKMSFKKSGSECRFGDAF